MSTTSHLVAARDKLQSNDIKSSGLPGREKHIDELYNFLFERLRVRKSKGHGNQPNHTTKSNNGEDDNKITLDFKDQHLNKTMFVCGVPGTGKTAVVLHVIEKLKHLTENLKHKDKCAINKFQSMYINGQHLTTPDRIYSEIFYELTGKKATPDKAQEYLDQLFDGTHLAGHEVNRCMTSCGSEDENDDTDSEETLPSKGSSKRKSKSYATKSKKNVGSRLPSVRRTNEYKVVVIDELDVLYNEKRQSVFYSLFDWPTSANSKLILIAIANAMNLPERFMRGRIGSRLGWNKLVFESYTSDCLEKILKARLGQDLLNRSFDKVAIKVATMRIGRSTGDARRIIDTCLLAIGKAIESNLSKVTAAIIDQVGFQNIDIMRREYVKRCTPLELWTLKCILFETGKFGEGNAEAYGVYRQLMEKLRKRKMKDDFNLGHDGFYSILITLAGVGLIHLEPNKPLPLKRLSIKDTSEVFRDYIRKEEDAI